MPKDWVRKYVESRRRTKDSDLRCSQVALARAHDVLLNVSGQVKEDVATYNGLMGATCLQHDFIPSKSFVVRKGEYPAVTLKVTAEDVTLRCEYSFKADDTCERRETVSLFRIVGDLAGNVQVKKDGAVYAEDCEISEAMLTPVFDFLN
jgi:hypothetical protein